MGARNIFHGFLNFDDWVWFLIVGGGFLVVVTIVVICCCCTQRARRKGREEALATLTRQQNEIRVDMDRSCRPVLAPKDRPHYHPKTQQFPVHYPHQESGNIYTPQRDESSKFEYHTTESPHQHSHAYRASAIPKKPVHRVATHATHTSNLTERINALRYRTSDIDKAGSFYPNQADNPKNRDISFARSSRSVDIDDDPDLEGVRHAENNSCGDSDTGDSYASSGDTYQRMPSSLDDRGSDGVDHLLLPRPPAAKESSTVTREDIPSPKSSKNINKDSDQDQFKNAESYPPNHSNLLNVDLDRDSRVSRNSVEF